MHLDSALLLKDSDSVNSVVIWSDLFDMAFHLMIGLDMLNWGFSSLSEVIVIRGCDDTLLVSIEYDRVLLKNVNLKEGIVSNITNDYRKVIL